jgi:hypothetical protein
MTRAACSQRLERAELDAQGNSSRAKTAEDVFAFVNLAGSPP